MWKHLIGVCWWKNYYLYLFDCTHNRDEQSEKKIEKLLDIVV
jgi:hypothetical protein